MSEQADTTNLESNELDPKVDEIMQALKDVIDPELGINVVDLGLLYDCRYEPDGTVLLDMTLTSAACPLQDVIEDQARTVLTDIAKEVKFNWVWCHLGDLLGLLMMEKNNYVQLDLMFNFFPQ